MEDLKLEDDDHVPQAFGVGPIPKFLASREHGLLGKRAMTYLSPRTVDELMTRNLDLRLLQSSEPIDLSPGLKNASRQATANRQADEVGEERLVVKDLETLPCKLNGTNTRSTFLMVFSPDKELLASTHGDHNIYITEVKTGKCIRTLSGHPRTPWCIAFHPSYATVLASGCLGGLVRVWDILSGGSEVWRTDGVIASLAFHPFDRLLVVATFNELHFWDWSASSRPFAKVQTNSDKEKVRYVKFDSTGHHLITGIANLTVPRGGATVASATGPSADRQMWVRTTSGHSEIAAEHLYGGRSLARIRNVSYFSDLSLPRYGRYRRVAYTPSSSATGRTTDRGTDPMLSATSTPSMTASAYNVANNTPGSSGRNPVQGSSRSTTHSASQTLSDLAAAASNQLMVENAAAAAASASNDLFYSSVDRWAGRGSSTQTTASNAAASSAAASREQLQDLPFTHSPQSSFREVAGVGEGQEDEEVNSLPSSTGATAGGEGSSVVDPDERLVFLTRRNEERGGAVQDQLRDLASRSAINVRLREYRIQELLERRDSLVNQIEELRTAQDILSSQNDAGSLPSAEEEPLRRTNGVSPISTTSDPLFEPPTRPIDEWAAVRRLRMESSQVADSVDALRYQQRLNQRIRNTNYRSTMLMDYLHRDPVLRNLNSEPVRQDLPPEPDPLEPTNPSVVEPEVRAEPESIQDDVGMMQTSAETDQVRNDHTYTQRPRETFEDEDLDLTQTPGTSGSNSNSNLLGNNNMDILLLSRHIAHMQRICRTSLQDCTRQRRQVVRLQSIRRMLEDLQRQIRSLRAASLEELQRRQNLNNEADRTDSAANGVPVLPSTSDLNADGEGSVRTSPGNLLDDRNYDERVGEGEHLAQLRNNSFSLSSTLNRLNRAAAAAPVSRRTGPVSSSVIRSARSPSSLMRARNRFLSQMRATFRALEMSPDLARNSNSPFNTSNAEASRGVMESLQPASKPNTSCTTTTSSTAPSCSATSTTLSSSMEVRPSTSTSTSTSSSRENNTREELRALSQRLEHQLRAMRESPGGEPEQQTSGDASESRRLESRPWLFTGSFLDTDSESDSDPVGIRDLLDQPFSRTSGPGRYLLPSLFGSSNEMFDLNGATNSSRRPLTARSYSLSRSESWRSSIGQDRLDSWRSSMGQDRLDSWREMRRDALRERQRLSRERDILRRRRRHRLLDGSGYTFHRNYQPFPPLGQDYEEDMDQEARQLPRPRVSPENVPPPSDVIPVDDEDEANVAGGGAAGSGERLPPLRELIWRRLRRRNAQLNMLDEELSSNNGDSQRSNLAADRSTRHRELLSWMVDQMRLDHVPSTPPVSSGASQPAPTDTTPVDRDLPPRVSYLTIPDSPPRFTIRMRRNAENFSTAEPVNPTNAPNRGSGRMASSANYSLPPAHAQLRMHQNRYEQQHFFMSNTPSSMLLTHRIQAWDFSKGDLPDISDENQNIIVKEAKIHNDASVDISEDGTLLVTLVPSNLPMTTVVGVYGLQPDANRGRCYATCNLESSAVSVSLSPTSRHLLVGLAIRAGRITLSPADRSLMAQIFRIKLPWDRNAERGRLVHRRDIHQTHEQGQTSLNCIRWIPVAGQGIVYATNTGLLKILR